MRPAKQDISFACLSVPRVAPSTTRSASSASFHFTETESECSTAGTSVGFSAGQISSSLVQSRQCCSSCDTPIEMFPEEFATVVGLLGRPYIFSKQHHIVADLHRGRLTEKDDVTSEPRIKSEQSQKKAIIADIGSVVTHATLSKLAREPNCELWINEKLNKIFIDHTNCRAFQGAERDDNIAAQRAVYFSYLKDHPSHHVIDEARGEEAKAALRACIADQIFNPDSCTPLISKAEAIELRALLETQGGADYTFIVANVLFLVYNQRLRQQFGTLRADEFRDATEYGKKRRQKWEGSKPVQRALLRLLMYLCLGTPIHYLSKIDHIMGASTVGHRAMSAQWSKYVTTLKSDWTTGNIIAALFLSVTVQALSINGICNLTRTLCLVSSIFSMGSLTVGSFFIWKHGPDFSDARLNSEYFDRRGAHMLAILISLPAAFSVYALLTFGAAIVTYATRGYTTNSPGDVNVAMPRETAMTVSLVFGFIVLLVVLGSTDIIRKDSPVNEDYQPSNRQYAPQDPPQPSSPEIPSASHYARYDTPPGDSSSSLPLHWADVDPFIPRQIAATRMQGSNESSCALPEQFSVQQSIAGAYCPPASPDGSELSHHSQRTRRSMPSPLQMSSTNDDSSRERQRVPRTHPQPLTAKIPTIRDYLPSATRRDDISPLPLYREPTREPPQLRTNVQNSSTIYAESPRHSFDT